MLWLKENDLISENRIVIDKDILNSMQSYLKSKSVFYALNLGESRNIILEQGIKQVSLKGNGTDVEVTFHAYDYSSKILDNLDSNFLITLFDLKPYNFSWWTIERIINTLDVGTLKTLLEYSFSDLCYFSEVILRNMEIESVRTISLERLKEIKKELSVASNLSGTLFDDIDDKVLLAERNSYVLNLSRKIQQKIL